MKKVLYVADNRNRYNFGCRATSIALYQILEEKFEIVGDISGKYTDGNRGIYCKFFPRIIYKIINGKNNDIRDYIWNGIINKLFSSKIKRKVFSWVSYNYNKSKVNLKKCIIGSPEMKELDLDSYDFDIMVINGEGTMIMSEPYRIDTLVYLFLCKWALKKDKRVYFINAMFSDAPGNIHNEKTIKYMSAILRDCSLISVREELSFQYIKKYMPECCNVKMYPDALFTWNKYCVDKCISQDDSQLLLPFGCESHQYFTKIDFSKPYICISGSSALHNTRQLVSAFVKLITFLKGKLSQEIILVEACKNDSFLEQVGKETKCLTIPYTIGILGAARILQNAQVYLSGRYHPSILASLGGTPCIFMDSNSHKNMALQQLLGYDNPTEYSSIPTEREFSDIFGKINKYINGNYRNCIKEKAAELSILAHEIISAID